MNKQILLFCFVLGLTPIVFGQYNSHLYDTLLNRELEKILTHPFDYNGGKFGVNVIKLSKKDSVFSLESIYKSDDTFSIINSEGILRLLKNRCGNYINNPLELFIPVLFSYDFEDLPKEILAETEKKINELKHQGKNVSNLRVMVIGLRAIR